MKIRKEISQYLKELRLPTINLALDDALIRAQKEPLGFDECLLDLLKQECTARKNNRIERYLKESGLPLEKNLATFDLSRVPQGIINQISTLKDASFLDRKENILVFGAPGGGKTHLLCALGQEMIYKSKKVLFFTCSILVQRLLIAKRDLKLPNYLRKLARHDAIIIDDIGYVQQSREEMEVLFSLLAHCYETTSIMLTSNLAFSEWEKIFKDPMVTAAAIDRLVHHSIILELNLPSYRLEYSKKQKEKGCDAKKEELVAS